MSQEQVPRPEVTLASSSAPSHAEREVEVPPRRGRRGLLLLPLALLGLALLRPVDEPPPPVPQPAPELVLLEDELVVTQGGVLVVALEVRNRGDALRVRSATAYAQAVVDDAVVQAPEVVRAGATRRFVALLAPDCRVLQPGSPLRFSASVLLEVARGSQAQQLVVDLTASPVLRERVASLCSSG